MAIKHGMSKTRIHSIWRKMRDRCNNPHASNYLNYGGRGISVCKEWDDNFMSFYKWALANEYNDHLSIERIDVNGNYEPTNCKWITLSEQGRNKRSTKYAVINGVKKPLIEWAELHDLSYKTISTRWSRGVRGNELIGPLRKVRKI